MLQHSVFIFLIFLWKYSFEYKKHHKIIEKTVCNIKYHKTVGEIDQ